MPRKSRLKLPPLDLGKETFGQRLTRLRKERGYTQVTLAKQSVRCRNSSHATSETSCVCTLTWWFVSLARRDFRGRIARHEAR